MAKNKKSFILYADYKELFETLSDENAGKLIKHILKYVNDESPTTTDEIVNISFIPIKLQLKRDLKNWEEFRQKQSENGKKGGRPEKPKPLIEKPKNPSLNLESQKSLNVTVTDTVNDTNKRKPKKVFVPPSLEEFEKYFYDKGYKKSVAVRAWTAYHESDWHDSHGKPVYNWKSKCNNVWFKDENKMLTTNANGGVQSGF